MYRSLLLAHRALELLIAQTAREDLSTAPRDRLQRAGVVGEGRGAGVALALAALAPDRVAFVAAHQPVGGAAPYLELMSFAPAVRCPTLLSYGGRDRTAPLENVLALYETLECEKQLAAFPRARHCQAEDLREWARAWGEWADGLQ